jgi:RND family efflux transporter MFP subunit
MIVVRPLSVGASAARATLVAGAIVLAGCVGRAPTIDSPPPEVTVSKPVVREVTDYFEFPGRTEAVSEVQIRARVTGYIVKVNFEDGQEVRKGRVLFEIDPRPYQAILDRANAELARLQAVRDKAQVDLDRSKRLRPSGAVSADEHEQRVAGMKFAKAAIASAEAAVTEAALNLEFTKVVSPIDGRMSSARIREGNLVQSGGNESTLLTTVVTTTPIYVCFNVDEHALLKYQELALQTRHALRPSWLRDLKFPVEIGLANEEGFPHAGTLDFADNKIDRGTGTIRIRGVFDNTKQYLTPGLFVRVRIPFGKPHKALLVSERAIKRDQRLKYVWTVDKENMPEYRQVTVGPLRDNMRVIESGIGPDDLVVVSGLQRIQPGKPVTPHLPGKQAIAATPAAAHGESKKAGGPATTN